MCIIFCRPSSYAFLLFSLSCLWAKLPDLNKCNGSYILHGFRFSYIVPLPKIKDHLSKSLSCDDFRNIAVSPAVLSKVFEHCILSKFIVFLCTADNQFGFNKVLIVIMLFAVFVASWITLLKAAVQ